VSAGASASRLCRQVPHVRRSPEGAKEDHLPRLWADEGVAFEKCTCSRRRTLLLPSGGAARGRFCGCRSARGRPAHDHCTLVCPTIPLHLLPGGTRGPTSPRPQGGVRAAPPSWRRGPSVMAPSRPWAGPRWAVVVPLNPPVSLECEALTCRGFGQTRASARTITGICKGGHSSMTFDLLIRDGLIVDGTEAEPAWWSRPASLTCTTTPAMRWRAASSTSPTSRT